MKGKRKDSDSKVVSAPETARPSDAELLILGVERLKAQALNTKDPASSLAGKILAYVDALIDADREKLLQNEAYREERLRLGKSLRKDLWSPESPLYLALHRELWHCWFYRQLIERAASGEFDIGEIEETTAAAELLRILSGSAEPSTNSQ